MAQVSVLRKCLCKGVLQHSNGDPELPLPNNNLSLKLLDWRKECPLEIEEELQDPTQFRLRDVALPTFASTSAIRSVV